MGSATGANYEFGGFRLEVSERRLVRDGASISLRAKVFDTLCLLVERRGQLVLKEDLMRELWPDATVEDNNLAHNISVLRKALGDKGKTPSFLETIPGRGYRFIGEVRTIHKEVPPAITVTPRKGSVPVIHREDELEQLEARLSETASGRGGVTFLTGEAGIGKTTLIGEFLDRARQSGAATATGHCHELRGATEPYMPVLEALSQLANGPDGDEFRAILRRYAPTWIAQMPWIDPGDSASPAGATAERMLREIVEGLEGFSAARTLVIVLEDLHWCDSSTVDLIERIARGRRPAKLLLVCTYRASEIHFSGHPLSSLAVDLVARDLADEIRPAVFNVDAVADYLQARYPGIEFPQHLVEMIRDRTSGNPLFLSKVAETWTEAGCLSQLEGAWRITGDVSLYLAVPGTLRESIVQQLDRLDTQDETILEAASAAGPEFCAAIVAAPLGLDPDLVESRLETLARAEHFVRGKGVMEWPDGTVCGRYAFTHHLYREILYERIPPGRRSRLHLQIGTRLEVGYGSRRGEVAAELAGHFVHGREPKRAIEYLIRASNTARQRSAHHDAVEHLQQANEMLRLLPEGPDRQQRELAVLTLLSSALVAESGFSSEEAERAFARAHELVRILAYPPESVALLCAMSAFYEVRGEYPRAQALLEERFHAYTDSGAQDYLVESLELMACSTFHQGDFNGSLVHSDRGLANYDPTQDGAVFASMGDDPGVACHTWAAFSLWYLGHSDDSLARGQEALRIAGDKPHSCAGAWTHLAILHQLRREPKIAGKHAAAGLAIARQYGFGLRAAMCEILLGWSIAILEDDPSPGINLMRDGIEECRAMGAEMDRPYFLSLLAEGFAKAGRLAEAMHAVEQGLAFVATRRHHHHAELHRLRGQLLSESDPTEAEASLSQAIKIAREQGAVALEDRASATLAELRSRQLA